MARKHSPLQQIKEAKQIALDHGMFVVGQKEGDAMRYLLYRQTEPRNTFIGKRASISGIRRLVANCAQ